MPSTCLSNMRQHQSVSPSFHSPVSVYWYLIVGSVPSGSVPSRPARAAWDALGVTTTAHESSIDTAQHIGYRSPCTRRNDAAPSWKRRGRMLPWVWINYEKSLSPWRDGVRLRRAWRGDCMDSINSLTSHDYGRMRRWRHRRLGSLPLSLLDVHLCTRK